MLELFAGFTYCDGFPFGGNDGTDTLFVAFLAALILGFFVTYPKFGETSSNFTNRHRIILVASLILVATLMAASAKHDFATECYDEVRSYPYYVLDMLWQISAAVLVAIAIATVIKLLLYGLHKLIKSIGKKSKQSD